MKQQQILAFIGVLALVALGALVYANWESIQNGVRTNTQDDMNEENGRATSTQDDSAGNGAASGAGGSLGAASALALGKIAPQHFAGDLLDNRGTQVTYRGRVVPGADPATFTLLSDPDPARGEGLWLSPYGVDEAHVYYVGDLARGTADVTLPHVDPATFAVVGWCSYRDEAIGYFTKDANAVYGGFDQEVIEGADPATFTIVGQVACAAGASCERQSVAKDGARVYLGCDGVVQEGVEPSNCSPADLAACVAQS